MRRRLSAVPIAIAVVTAAYALASCGGNSRALSPKSQTWAELRVVRRGVRVLAPGEKERSPYPQERLVDGQKILLQNQALAWLRRDGGASLLVAGPAALEMSQKALIVEHGKVFIDTPPGISTDLQTPRGLLHLAQVRASLVVDPSGTVSIYVLSGEVQAEGAPLAGPGQQLILTKEGPRLEPVVSWQDWTGGLATTDRTASPAPYGVGTVGARLAGEIGKPRWPLAIQKLDVDVRITDDLAVTEVDETFFNPTSQAVEGVYSFRTPLGATLHRFGVDREDQMVWGYVKERQQAAAQYQGHVYAGSTENPALLEWDAPGVYRARLYPIDPGKTRRVITRYAQWLPRTGENGERRLYLYPMAAEGAEQSLPRIEELTITIHLDKANAKEVRVGMDGMRQGNSIIVRQNDVVPRADLAVELFDDGLGGLQAFRAPHMVDPELLAPGSQAEANKIAKSEADYLLVPLRPTKINEPSGGLDLAIVVDASAATDPASFAVARAATDALLTHLGPEDRVALWAGDVRLRPVIQGSEKFAPLDEARRQALRSALARVDRGGATDLGAILADAASQLDPKRRSAVVYIGDGKPTVGELSLKTLRERLDRLAHPVRLFTFGVGDDANMGLLAGIAHGAFSERVTDAYGAAKASLRLLEEAERPSWLGADVSLGPTIANIYPRSLGARPSDETTLVVGRVRGTLPAKVKLTGPGGENTLALEVRTAEENGDLMRRWAEGRLTELLDDGAGRAAVVDVGMRYGVLTPFTSIYVPTTEEARAQNRLITYRKHTVRPKSAEPTRPESVAVSESSSDDKQGGTGTRAKGEEGSMGNADAHMARQKALREAAEFGMIGMLGNGKDAPAAAAPTPTTASAAAAPKDEADRAQIQRQMEELRKQDNLSGRLATGGMGKASGSGARSACQCQQGDPLCSCGGEEPIPQRSARVAEAPVAIPAPPPAPPKAPSGGPASSTAANQPADIPTDDSTVDGLENGWGNEVGDAFGQGGLGLSGAGEGGGGAGDLSGIGTIGHGQGFGSGHGRLGGNARGEVTGDVEKAVEQRIAKLKEQLQARQVGNGPGAWGSSGGNSQKRLGDFGHRPTQCSPAAQLPLDERVSLWRERLSRIGANPTAALRIYRTAVASCEAPSWRERSRLLSMMVDTMGSVASRVSLWRQFGPDKATSDALYGMILVRIRSAEEMRQLHQALGLRTIDSKALQTALKDAKTPADRVQKLRELVTAWPADLSLSLMLLDALEDAQDLAGARDLARSLRREPNADAAVRTAVGELYLRLASHGGTQDDSLEGLRTFGEIVEFAPDDPVARRRLGDLLRAHGYFELAARQYETLEQLMPDDATVPLLRAAASQGLGKTEEAVRWTEKAASANAPDGASGSAKTARALALSYLAWARQDAQKANQPEVATRLLTRAKTLLASDSAQPGVRLSLVWAHPDFHPVLWTDALGALMPASDGDPLLGIAQAVIPSARRAVIEVRMEPDQAQLAARFGLEATLTAVFHEGTDKEQIVRIPVRLTAPGALPLRFIVADGSVTPEVR